MSISIQRYHLDVLRSNRLGIEPIRFQPSCASASCSKTRTRVQFSFHEISLTNVGRPLFRIFWISLTFVTRSYAKSPSLPKEQFLYQEKCVIFYDIKNIKTRIYKRIQLFFNLFRNLKTLQEGKNPRL